NLCSTAVPERRCFLLASRRTRRRRSLTKRSACAERTFGGFTDAQIDFFRAWRGDDSDCRSGGGPGHPAHERQLLERERDHDRRRSFFHLRRLSRGTVAEAGRIRQI